MFHNPLNPIIDNVLGRVGHVFAAIQGGTLPSTSFHHCASLDSRSLSLLQDLDGPSAASHMKIADELMNTNRSVSTCSN